MSTPHEPPPRPSLPFLFRFRSSKTTIISVIALAVCTDTFLYSVVVPVLPFSLNERLGVPMDEIQKYVSLLLATYALGIMLFSPICGYFADRYPSRQGPFLLGLVALASANAALCFGNSLPILFAARFLQGCAAAMVWSIGYAMVPETVGTARAGAAIGWVTMGTGVGILVGPTAGGWVYDRWGYYAVFKMSSALLAVDVFFRSLLIERKTAERIELTLERWELRFGEGIDSAQSTDVSDILDEDDRVKEPDKELAHKFPIGLLLSTPRFLSALWGVNVIAMMLTAFDSVLTLFVHRTFGWGATEAGLIFLAVSVSSLFDPLFGHLSDKYGPRRLTLTAFIMAVPSFLILQMVQTDSQGSKIILCLALTMIGLCICLGMTPLTAECSAVVDEYKRKVPGVFGVEGAFAQCFALCNVAFALGSLLGPLWAGYITETFSFGMMGISLAVLCLISIYPTYLFCGRDLDSRMVKDHSMIPATYGTM